MAAPAELDGGRAIDIFLNRVFGDPIENPLSADGARAQAVSEPA